LPLVGEMSPTILRAAGLRFSFYSKEGPRMHVHAWGASGAAKIWIEPTIELAENRGLSRRQLSRAMHLVRQHERAIREAWEAYFGR
jgi:hypothetical protein